jgi:hypothetical protein
MIDLLHRGYLTGACIVMGLLIIGFLSMLTEELRNVEYSQIKNNVTFIIWLFVWTVGCVTIITLIGTIALVIFEGIAEVI